ncbi:MAG: sulfatase [Verrucomicrobiota bacterium]
MKTLSLLIALGSVISLSVAKDRPNFLFIIADDLSAEAMGTYGNEVCKTPHLDRLAESGIRFDAAYCQYPVCGASRASFMSGLYPETTGFLGNNYTFGSYRATNEDFADHPSIGSLLRNNGYVSTRVSKIYHMGVPGGIEAGEPGGDDPDSWDRAFDVWAPETGSVGEFTSLSPAVAHWGSSFVKVVVPDGESATQADEMAVTQAISILETRARHRNKTNRMKRGAPLFLAVGLVRPHVPLVAPERFFKMYDPEDMVLPHVPENDFSDVPKGNQGKANATSYQMNEDTAKEALAAYYASVSYMDEQVGRLLDALDRLEMSDNTVVVFISDHGWLLGEHGSWQKPSLFEPACRVPLIVRAPGFEANAGRASKGLTELIDLYPTFAEIAGLAQVVPERVQGRSLVPLLEDPSGANWSAGAAYSVMGKAKNVQRSLRTERYRYSRYATGEEELYDHDRDPEEYTNQAGNPEYAKELENLRERMDRKMGEVK